MPGESSEERAARIKRLNFLCNSKDKEAIRCRLYVFGFANENINKHELIALFSPYGRVYDLTVHGTYVFVQYDNMDSSLTAISKLNDFMYRGKKISVKLAEKGRKEAMAEKEFCRFFAQGGCMRGATCNFRHSDPKRARDNGPQLGASSSMSSMGSMRNGPVRDNMRDRAPIGNRDDRFADKPREGNGLPPPNKDFNRGLDRSSDRDRRDMGRESGGLFDAGNRPVKRSLPDDFDSMRHSRPAHMSSSGGRPTDGAKNGPQVGRPNAPLLGKPHQPTLPVGRSHGLPSSGGGEPRRPILESPHRSSADPKPVPAPMTARREEPPVDLRPPFDCVIIAGNEAQRNYCRHIDQKLAGFGMLTNVQVVDGEHLLKRAVEEASRHTVPYTICVTANNEEHRSLTLNILHGVAQEHRNMPLDDAMPFLSRNFDNFVELMKQKISAVNEWVPPEKKVAYLLKLLADGRRLSKEEMLEINGYVKGVLSKMEAPSGGLGSGLREEPGKMGMSRSMLDSPVDVGPPKRHPMEVEKPAPQRHVMDMLMERGQQSTSRPMDQFSRNDSRPSGGLLGSGGPPALNQSSSARLDFENPAVKRALDDLLSNRPSMGARDTGSNRGYNMF